MKPSRPLDQIAAAIKSTQPPPGVTCKIIAIDGLGGAGKSTLGRQLSQALGGVPVIATDDFASWDNQFGWWPDMIENALKPLANDRPARFRRSDWLPRTGEEWIEIEPNEIIILEGVSASCQALRPYLAYSIWVDTPRELRLRRGLERGGGTMRAKWEKWMQAEDGYIKAEQPQKHADIIINGAQP